jgi:hypothetical protein
MAEFSTKLRVCGSGYVHWCEPCGEIHVLPTGRGWTYSGAPDQLTATPSFKHSWRAGGAEPGDKVCHYILTDGVLHYCGDSTHGFAGSQALPDLPADYRDFEDPLPLPESDQHAR